MRFRRTPYATDAPQLGIAAAAFAVPWVRASQRVARVLYFTRSAGYLHSAVRRNGSGLAFSESIFASLGKRWGIDVVCTKDGRVFDDDLEPFDAIAFYTLGDLTQQSGEKSPPMSRDGKQRLLDAVAAGKGFIGFHAASDSFLSRGDGIDPYIEMVGGEFITHARKQIARLRVVSPDFPGAEGLGDSFEMHEEWYALKNFARDLHVILVQETAGMRGECYQRPPFPSTWARLHGKGRVFYTSLGHKEAVWNDSIFQQVVQGGCSWVLGRVDADATPNLDAVTPHAGTW